MGFFNDLKTKYAEITKSLTNEFLKYKNKDVLNALMATCAYIASADGTIDPVEKRKMVGLVKNSPIISVYGDAIAINVFNEHATRFEFDFGIGKAEALCAIGKFRDNVDLARLIIRAGIVIGSADGNFDPSEKEAVRDICKELGQNPDDFVDI